VNSGLYFAFVGKRIHDFQPFQLGKFTDGDHLFAGRALFMIRGLAHIYGGAVRPAFCFLSIHTPGFWFVLWLRYASQPKNWKVFVYDGRSARAATMKSL
jgi:hypothetical protein